MSSTFSLDDVDYIPLLTKEVKEGKFKSVDPRFLDVYRRYSLREPNCSDYTQIASILGMASPAGIDTQFAVIKGRISELRGKMFELAILEQYILSGMVVSMEPAPVLEYPAGCAAEKTPDRIITLLDSTIRICSWKCLQGNNATINLGVRKRGGGYLHCPEIRKARQLIELGGSPDFIKVILEGVLGRRANDTIVPEYFQLEIDPYTDARSATIPRAGRVPWPPSVFALTGIQPKVL